VIPRYEVEAFNTATASSNKIHDDAVAREFGFRGGLVPGVDVYAYMTHLPAAQWGLEWLGSGTMSARFVQPVYDGEPVTVHGEVIDGEMTLSVTGSDGTVRATGRAAPAPAPAADRPLPPRSPQPQIRPPASADSLRPGTVLGSLTGRFDAAGAPGYLTSVREDLAFYTEKSVAHPGWLLRFANTVLAESVALGPWIHVSSDVELLDLVEAGDAIDVRAEVTGEYERRGHRFVELDVAVLAGDRPVQRIAHTAIHTPRRLAASEP
jgi:acyl dehydratase